MGNLCSSTHIIRKSEALEWPSTAKVIHMNGKLQEFKVSIKVSHILSQYPNSFLCSSESMYINSYAPQLPIDQELQLGQLYFLIPISKANVPLSLQDLCSLAIKASTALQTSRIKIIPAAAETELCNSALAGYGAVGVNPLAANSSQRIEMYSSFVVFYCNSSKLIEHLAKYLALSAIPK